MTGSNPKPPRASRRRAVQPSKPWPLVSLLFLLYLLAGLLLSAPQPPFWLWILAAIAIPLLTIGLISPMAPGEPPKRTGLLTYLGGLLLTIALSIALNYVGSDQSFDNTGFFTAIFMLAALTLLAIGLAGATAIVSALAGDRLLQTNPYKSSLTTLLGAAFCGLLAGGLMGFLATTLVSGVQASA